MSSYQEIEDFMTMPERKLYNRWRVRILISIIMGYGMYYLCRQNFSMIMPAYMEEFGYSKTELGAILSEAAIVYGIGKFVNGYFSDQSNARYFMPLGLAASAIINFSLGFANESLIFLGFLWVINNWFQSMGWPPAARMLTHWFSPKELGAKWALGASSHQIGGAITIVFTGYLVEQYGWRYAFYLPGIIAFVASILLYSALRDSPTELGMPPVEMYKGEKKFEENCTEEENISTMEIIEKVFLNLNIWFIALANLCLYIVRIGIIFWAPIFLKELKEIELTEGKYYVAAYEVIGLLGGFCAGYASDTLTKGQRGPIAALYMILLAFSLAVLWQIPVGYDIIIAVMMVLVGFFVYGPQVLVGVASADFSSKKAIGTANGFVGSMAYIGAAISGGVIGKLVDNHGWNAAFMFFIGSAILGCFCFLLTWVQSERNKSSRIDGIYNTRN